MIPIKPTWTTKTVFQKQGGIAQHYNDHYSPYWSQIISQMLAIAKKYICKPISKAMMIPCHSLVSRAPLTGNCLAWWIINPLLPWIYQFLSHPLDNKLPLHFYSHFSQTVCYFSHPLAIGKERTRTTRSMKHFKTHMTRMMSNDLYSSKPEPHRHHS